MPLPKSVHLFLWNKLASSRLLKTLLDRSPLIVRRMIEFLLLGLEPEQHVRRVLLPLRRPSQDTIEDRLDLLFRHNATMPRQIADNDQPCSFRISRINSSISRPSPLRRRVHRGQSEYLRARATIGRSAREGHTP